MRRFSRRLQFVTVAKVHAVSLYIIQPRTMGAKQSADKSGKHKSRISTKRKKKTKTVEPCQITESIREDQAESVSTSLKENQDLPPYEIPTEDQDESTPRPTEDQDESAPRPTEDQDESAPRPTEDENELVRSPRRVYECNGMNLPQTESKQASFFNRISGNVVAIDFGTTFCSMFYSLHNSNEIIEAKLDGTEKRIPTAILLNDRGEILAFGDEARCQYEDKQGEDINRHYYFHHIKMLLERDRKISRNSLVEADNGQEFFLVEVIAMMLKHLKDRMLTYEIRDQVDQVDPNNLTWVLTVPAIWEAEGKQMMREAAYLAGIASTGLEISRLTQRNVSSCTRAKPDETKIVSENLILALEPEAAALYCLDDAEKVGNPSANASNYVVIDAGGGTLDITAHRLTKESGSRQIEVVMPPCGNDAGGNQVNEEFMTYLENLVEDEKFSSMLQNTSREEKAQNRHELDKIRERFERKKVRFGDGHIKSSNVNVELPSLIFMEKYREILTNKQSNAASNAQPNVDQSSVNILSGTHTFSREIFKNFFKNTLKKAMELIKSSLCENDLHTTIDAVFCVGGFGGCSLFHDEVKELINSINTDITVYRPQKHSFAVVRGAIAFGKTPDIIKSRKAGATYGTGICTTFIEGLHNVDHKFKNDDQQLKCDHVFSPYVLIGDKVHIDECLFNHYNPLEHNQEVVTFNLYRTEDNVDIPYTHKLVGPLSVTNKHFELVEELRHVGKLTLTLPEDEKNLDKNRRIKLTFDFAHTEIHVEAYDCDYDKKVSSTIDFLTQ